MNVCSSDFLYHALLNSGDEIIFSILEQGLRPLSDFPGDKRWEQIYNKMPGFFENLYEEIARPVLQKPYLNSGIFVSPIDFRRLPQTPLYEKTRVKIPLARINAEYACLTYVWEGERISLPLTRENLRETARLWTADKVMEWFGRDQSKIFYYVPQIAVYQPGGIPVKAADIERF